MELDGKNQTVEEKLAAAASSTPETVEKGTKEATEENRIPQSRFNEVNNALKEVRAAESVAREQLAETQNKLVRMAELLEAKEADIQTLNEIRGLVADPSMKDHVLAIDAKLRGVELEVENKEITPEDALEKTRALLEQTREEMRDTQADVQADLLIQKADSIASQLLGALPEEYNESDRAVINDLFIDKIDWDAVVANPGRLLDTLTEGFQTTVDRYGVPRGALFSTDEVEELTPQAATQLTPEQELKALMEQNWGETKTVDLPGGKQQTVAAKSDDDFSKALAGVLRKAHGR